MNAVIVGISGIGKEYVRSIKAFGGDVIAIVDHPSVIMSLSRKGWLKNTFPGHEFEMAIPNETRLLYAAHSNLIERLRPTHIFICTPNDQHESNLYEYLEHARDAIIHIEKPARINWKDFNLDNLSVGYLPLAVDWPVQRYETRNQKMFYAASSIPPVPTDWRWKEPGAVWWDLGSYTLAMAAHDFMRLGGLNFRLEWVRSSSISFEAKLVGFPEWTMAAQYTNEPYGMTINGQPLDWQTAFNAQLARISDPTYRRHTRDVAWRVELELARMAELNLGKSK